MIALASIGSTIANSRPAQYAIGIGIVIVGFLWWLADRDADLLKNERLRQERKALEKDQAIKDHSNEAVKAADTIRSNTERLSSARLPDEQPGDHHFRD